jgi:hypothetical protein
MPRWFVLNSAPLRNESLTTLVKSLFMNRDPFGIEAALAERKRNRPAYRAQERSDASRKGWVTRKAA